jgi:hypothetical protein
VLVVFPRFSDLAPRIMIEPEIIDERRYITGTFRRAGMAAEPFIVGIEPTADEIRLASERAETADATVLFLHDAHLYQSNRQLLAGLEARAGAMVAVLLRDPYDAALLGPQTLGITAYGFRKCQLDALIGSLKKT